ncbi:hypothetical protein GCM10010260_58440 [Streptomyces filipinensis]|uniref:Transposase IS116/IS110/IS902 C-terminal domain-containing protein n=1 Tax=Streptomyces filipinensis TaxID=66887 RepID=A0A918MEB7_9ACTN|nr:transposase [Streptomyces filipinensis]GGV12132.1 hypothetical protein GCM10010260_58440 [Streptomyces filipinensis]
MADRLEVIDALKVVIDRLDDALAQAAKADPRVKALTTLLGIGPLTALVIVAEIGDIRRWLRFGLGCWGSVMGGTGAWVGAELLVCQV